MTDPLIFPVFAQAALIFVLMLMTFRSRVGALRSGRVKIKDIALDNSAWPEDVKKVSNCFNNQFQAPILFFIIVMLIIGAGASHAAYAALAWAFVAARLVHAYIFVTSNNVPRRFYAFAASSIALISMWVLFAAESIQIIATRS
ncbi:MAG: hypothetical protein Tsb0010_05660 [Parvularculaceae bacterium]